MSESIVKDLGAVTAYASAVEGGYTGTYEDFCKLEAGFAKAATEVKANADQVAQDKSTVQEYAQNAYNSAVGAENAKDDAEDARDEIRSMGAEAVTLSPGSNATASYSDGLLSLGIPRGDKGETGATGATGPKGDTGEQGPKGDKGDPGEVTQAEFDEALAKKSSAIYEGIESIPLATFADGAEDMPLKDLKVAIEPVQEGTGDPSPDNVRPITGWTGAKVTRTGVNVWNEEWKSENGYWDTSNGRYMTGGGTWRGCADYIPISPSTTYRLYVGVSVSGIGGICCYDKDKNFIRAGWPSSNETFTTPSNACYITFYAPESIWSAPKSISINYPATDTDYHSGADNETYTIDLNGTRYGGTLDVTNGVLTVDRAQIASYAGETLPSTWISDRDVYSAGATPTTGAQVVYELATPITYTLTPTEIRTLLGQNNIWADAGDTSVTYKADTKLYIDKKFTELQALILEN